MNLVGTTLTIAGGDGRFYVKDREADWLTQRRSDYIRHYVAAKFGQPGGWPQVRVMGVIT